MSILQIILVAIGIIAGLYFGIKTGDAVIAEDSNAMLGYLSLTATAAFMISVGLYL